MNVKKTELHAMNQTKHTRLSTPTGTTISTFNTNNQPHSFYKYLGVFIFTNPDPALLQQLILSEIHSFFSNLASIPLLPHEYVLLYNTQLIPILCYRLTMHSLPLSSIQTIESSLWQGFSKSAGISSVTSPKDRFVPPSRGGLGLHHFGLSLHKQTLNGILDAFPWGAWPRDAAVDTHKQAGRQSTALTGASSCSCHVTKRFMILATLKQRNKSIYSNTSGYVHMG